MLTFLRADNAYSLHLISDISCLIIQGIFPPNFFSFPHNFAGNQPLYHRLLQLDLIPKLIDASENCDHHQIFLVWPSIIFRNIHYSYSSILFSAYSILLVQHQEWCIGKDQGHMQNLHNTF